VRGTEPAPLQRSLEQLSTLAAIRGDRAQAARWSDAATLVAQHGIESELDLEPLIDRPPGHIDPGTIRDLRAVCEAGAWVLLESAIADLPADLRWLYESEAVSLDQIAALHGALGVTTTSDLIAEVRRDGIARVPGFDRAIQERVAAVLPMVRTRVPRLPLGRALAMVEPVLRRLRETSGVEWACPAGSLRRGHELVGDIEVVAAAADPPRALDAVAQLGNLTRTLLRSVRRLYGRFEGVQIGVRVLPPETAGASLLLLTGSHAHVERLRLLAGDRGWTLEPEGLLRPGLHPIADREEAIYEALGLPAIAPEIRDGEAEIRRALEGTLPALVSREAIRGDLHMHTHWSDGRDSIETMVGAAVALGYEYIAITDHSQSAAAGRSLTIDAVSRQADEIAALRERFPQIAILHGCEVDILESGRLDFDDHILERFDIVLASLHEAAGHAPDRLLRRYREAMRHPLVAIITHPTNRLVPHRPGYDLDYDRLFDAARETRTALEIDGAPSHLDLDGVLARRAAAAGVMLAIDSDSHRADALDRQMELGLRMARRGWIEPQQVINTRPLAELRAFVAGKRSG
jgi:DNA polymerase (family 10)